MQIQEVHRKLHQVTELASSVFIGQSEVLEGVIAAIMARGHVLLEGVPGVGKTLLVRILGKVLGCDFKRVQFTPDLMPSDITGASLYNEREGRFEFKPGPMFTQLLLADEVNRAPAKTQAAMLEAMAEGSVTVEGVTHPLSGPFFVLATQNPVESAGTYPLPEAQLDRFLFKLLIEHPNIDEEERLLRMAREGFDASRLEEANLQAISSPAELMSMQAAIDGVRVDDTLIGYIAQMASKTRLHSAVLVGASPRASIALLRVARVQAVMEGRDFVIPDDVKTHAPSVLRHRLILQPDAEIEGVTSDEVISAVLRETEVPGGKTQQEPVGQPIAS